MVFRVFRLVTLDTDVLQLNNFYFKTVNTRVFRENGSLQFLDLFLYGKIRTIGTQQYLCENVGILLSIVAVRMVTARI